MTGTSSNVIMPPLPGALGGLGDGGAPQDGPVRELRPGCWLLSYTPVGSDAVQFDGPMRIERHAQGRTASGDLYQRRVLFVGQPKKAVLDAAPKPSDGVPILPRDRYRYYLSVTRLLEGQTTAAAFDLAFDLWRFTAPSAWAKESALTASMVWIPAPPLFPSASDYLEGDVRNAAGVVVARLKMGWVSGAFRRAVLEIDAVAGCERPQQNGIGRGWPEIFGDVGWDVRVELSDVDVAQPSGDSWSDAEMHAAMLARRATVDLDQEWRYHILAVKLIDSTPRGIMYDAAGTDSNNVPREGVGIATNWMIPNTPDWGLSAGQRFGAATAPFFRTAVHELGHAFGLFHNTVDNGFMNTTDVISASATPGNPFPNNIRWSYAADDLKRLRHYPDVFVRPGGSAFGSASSTSPNISPTDLEVQMEGLELRLKPLLAEAPIGAPIRVGMELINVSDTPQRTPATLSLKSDFVHGWVTDPAGIARSFSPMVRCIEDCPMQVLKPGGSLTGDLTLLRGRDGPLFPSSGLYTIRVETHWPEDTVEAVVAGETTVLITGVENAAHAAAAHEILSTPDAHVVLVVGGDHLSEGMAAIQTAVADPVLGPHYGIIEAKRLANLPQGAARNEKAIVKLLSKGPVASRAERQRLDQGLKATATAARSASMSKALKAFDAGAT